MTRDPDLIRSLMLHLEEIPLRPGGIEMLDMSRLVKEPHSREQVWYHVNQILMCGWIDTKGGGNITPSGQFPFGGLTPTGHDFIDTVRDEKVWKQTKEAVNRIGGFTLDTLLEVGKAFLKKQLKNLTDLDM